MTKPWTWRRVVALKWWRERDTVADEFAHHIALRESELRAQGQSADDARAAALAQFGDHEDAERYCEAQDGARRQGALRLAVLDDLRRDVAHGARQLRRHPGLTIATIATLTLGIAMLFATIMLANAYLVRALPYRDASRIVQIIPAPTVEQFPRMPSLRGIDWRAIEPAFDGTVAWDLDGFTLAGGQTPEYVDGAWVSPGFFDVLGLSPTRGRAFSSDEYAGDARVAMISHGLWQRRFGGDPNVVGNAIRIHSTDRPGEQDLVTIVGVLPASFWHVTRFTDVLRPLTTPRMPSLARIPPGARINDVASRLNAAVRPQVGNADPDWRMSLLPLQAEYTRQARPVLLALVIGGALMLLLASANVAGLLVVRSATRRSEFAVRSLLGAGRARMARQILVEAAVPALSATVLAVAATDVLLSRAGSWMQSALGVAVPGGTEALSVDWRALVVAAPLTLLIAGFTGWRAYRASASNESQAALRSAGWQNRNDVRTRRILVSAQVAMTFAMLVGAGLMARTVWKMRNVPLGFATAGVTKATVLLPQSRFASDSARGEATRKLVEAIAAIPSVAAVASVWPHPFRAVAPTALNTTPAGSPPASTNARAVVVTPAYFDVVRIELLAGRPFDARDVLGAERTVVVTEALARQLVPSGQAVGTRVRLGDAEDPNTPWRTVVGVVRDVRSSLAPGQPPELYIPSAQEPRAYTSFVVRSRSGTLVDAASLRHAAAGVDDLLALTEIEPISDVVQRESSRQRFLATLLATLAVYALVLSAFGLAAALGFAVMQRRREIALRLAVGGSPQQIMRLILREAAITTTLGVVVGGIVSALLARTLASQLYGVGSTDPVTYAAIAAVIVVVTALAAVIPAKRAAAVDPAQALRS